MGPSILRRGTILCCTGDVHECTVVQNECGLMEGTLLLACWQSSPVIFRTDFISAIKYPGTVDLYRRKSWHLLETGRNICNSIAVLCRVLWIRPAGTFRTDAILGSYAVSMVLCYDASASGSGASDEFDFPFSEQSIRVV